MASSPIGRYQIEDAPGVGYDTSRGRSAVLWANTLDNYENDRTLGTLYSDDFTDARLNTTVNSTNKEWFLAEAGVAAATAEAFSSVTSGFANAVGEVNLSATVTTATHIGVMVTYGTLATASIGTTALPGSAVRPRGKVTNEYRFNALNTAAFFIGQADPSGATLTTVSAMSATLDYIGFHRLTSAGDISFVCSNGGTGGSASSVVVATSAQIQTGYNKLGWSVDRDNKVIITRNGEYLQAASDSIAAATLPNILLARRIATTRGGEAGTSVSFLVDWFDDHTSDA